MTGSLVNSFVAEAINEDKIRQWEMIPEPSYLCEEKKRKNDFHSRPTFNFITK